MKTFENCNILDIVLRSLLVLRCAI